MASKTPGTAAAFIPPQPTISGLRTAAAGCTACPLYAHATQTVFGEGPSRALLMLIGETPGDQEDLQGRPFVGPAGKLLDRCLDAASIDRLEILLDCGGRELIALVPAQRERRIASGDAVHCRFNAADIRVLYD